MPKIKNHEVICLKLDMARDMQIHRMKHRTNYLLKHHLGGSNLGSYCNVTFCGKRIKYTSTNMHEVTCPRCKKIYAHRFPGPPINPRSGMAMPRPGKPMTKEQALEKAKIILEGICEEYISLVHTEGWYGTGWYCWDSEYPEDGSSYIGE